MERSNSLYSGTGQYEEVKIEIEDNAIISIIQPDFNAKQDDNQLETKSENVQLNYLQNEMKIDIQMQDNKNYNVDIIDHLEAKRKNPNDSQSIEDKYGLAEIKIEFEEQIIQQDEPAEFLIDNTKPGVSLSLKQDDKTNSRILENLEFHCLENDMKIDIQRQENDNYNIDISEQMEMKTIEENYDQTEIKMEFEEEFVQKDEVAEFSIDNVKPVVKNFECDLCEKSFKTHVYLNKHKKSMHTECRNYKCSICERAFKKRCHLKRHIKLHTNDNPFPCDMCEKSFATSSCLVRHKLCHTEHRNYKCSMCDEAYKSIAYLNAHIKRVHTESRNFRCEKCESTFKTNSDLNNHARVHTDERPFSCALCNKGFKRHSSLSKHFRTRVHKKHLNAKLFV